MARPDITRKARSMRKNATEAERKLWSKLSRVQMDVKFRRQHPVPPYIVDFYCPSKGLIIEVDGGQHNDTQKKYDQKRTAFLEEKGYSVLRFWNNEVMQNIEAVVHIIRTELNALPSLPNPPSRKQEGGKADSWKDDFPILFKEMNEKPLTFLDSAASAQKPRVVIETLKEVMEGEYANIHRGLYGFSQSVTDAYEAVRRQVSRFIGASSDKEIVFTRNATESINLVAASWGGAYLKQGDEIILSEMEHHANIVPWQILRDRIGFHIKVIPVFDHGVLDIEAYKALLSPRTKLVSIVHVSNTLGTVNNVKEISRIAKEFNPEIKVLIDGTQSVVHRSVHMEDLGCDFFAFTGHKLYGPTGVGVLYAKYDVLESMPPYQGGGDMISRVSFDKAHYQLPPARFEAGTPPILEVLGLGAALSYLETIGMDQIEKHEADVLAYGIQKLQNIDGLTLYGTAPDKVGVLSFRLDGIEESDVAHVLDQMGIAVRTGHHCCMPLMTRLGIEGTVRASLALYSEKGDIDRLVEGLVKARDILG